MPIEAQPVVIESERTILEATVAFELLLLLLLLCFVVCSSQWVPSQRIRPSRLGRLNAECLPGSWLAIKINNRV